MKKIVIVAILMFGVLAGAQDVGVLDVQSQLTIKTDDKNLNLNAGKYPSSVNFGNSRILLNVQTGPQLVESVKFKYKYQGYEDNKSVYKTKQNLLVKKYFTESEKIIGAVKTEERSCVIQTITSQENCRIEYSHECDFFGENCKDTEHIVCETKTTEIKGYQDVTFEPKETTVLTYIDFVDAASGVLRAKFSKNPLVYKSENVKSKTRCKM